MTEATATKASSAESTPLDAPEPEHAIDDFLSGRMIASHVAEQEDELSVPLGTLVTLIASAGDWLYVERRDTSQEGMVPRSCVHIARKAAARALEIAEIRARGEATPREHAEKSFDA